ncbi:MAG: hypothetical protein U5L10_00195 [Candidatus Moranbacteria bacterium]|nr:hypothetical protein [Candidatus Moranbacteria bacterium]
MKKKNKTKKCLVFSLLCCFLWAQGAYPAYALFGGGIHIPSVKEVLNKVEKRYGFDQNVLRRSDRKKDYPEADIFFDTSNPKEGEKVTATAQPRSFKTANNNLYYTWFLIKEEDDPDSEKDIMEKAKRRAMGIVARGDFDPYHFNVDYSEGADEDLDDDSFWAPMGGRTGKGGKTNAPEAEIGKFESVCYLDNSKRVVDPDCVTRCYRHNFGVPNASDAGGQSQSSQLDYMDNSGRDLIVECDHKFPEAPKGETFANPYDGAEIECKDDYKLGDGEFTTNEEACWKLDPNNPDTDGDGVRDEADLAGLNQQQFTWRYEEGDRVGVIIEGTSMVPTNEGKGYDPMVDTTVKEDLEMEQELDASASATGQNSSSSAESSGSQSASLNIEQNISKIENAAGAVPGLNAYYKITWASVDTCSGEKMDNGYTKKEFVLGDECEDKDTDFGYPYLATVPVHEHKVGALKADLSHEPRKPQADIKEHEYSSNITVNASLNEEATEEEFVYYKWDVYYCKEGYLDSCTEDAQDGTNQAELLTEDCAGGAGGGDVLGDCSKGVLKSNSYTQGLALSDIQFKPTRKFFQDKAISEKSGNFYFLVYLETKRSRNSSIISVSKIPILVSVNNTQIRFYKIERGSDGVYEKQKEICTTSLYNKVCPTYPFQIIAAQADIEDAESADYIWEINGQKINAPLNSSECLFEEGCVLDDIFYFPATGRSGDMQKISMKAEKQDEENINSERLISVSNPISNIRSDNETAVWPKVIENVTKGEKVSDKVFLASLEKRATMRADVVPNYLESDDYELIWYWNGAEVDEEFIEKRDELDIKLEENKITFNILGEAGESINLQVETAKKFTEEEKRDLKEMWGFNKNEIKKLTAKKAITIRKTEHIKESDETAHEGSVKYFLASTYKNAPEYIVFSLRLSIAVVLFWLIILGFSAIETRRGELKNKKE